MKRKKYYLEKMRHGQMTDEEVAKKFNTSVSNVRIAFIEYSKNKNPFRQKRCSFISIIEIIISIISMVLVFFTLNIDENFIVSNDKIILLFHARDFVKRPQKKIKKAQSIFFPYYPLTEAGRQLLKIIDNESEYNPILNLGEAINNHRKSSVRHVTAHEISKIEENLVFYDPENLLC